MNEELMKSEEPKKMPWDMMDGEPLKAFGAFEEFLSQGIARSYNKTAKNLKLAKTTIARYAKKWNWNYRASLHDNIHAELRRNDALLEIEKRHEEMEKIYQDMTLYASRAMIETSNFFRDYWAFYDNPQTDAKLKFINRLIGTINKLFKMLDRPMPGDLYTVKSKRNININYMLKLKQNMKSLETESDFAYKNIMDENEIRRLPLHNNHVQNIPDKLPANWKEKIEQIEKEPI
ncbi:MAG: hypothetical protein HW421_251 [Ignavibacteria bacterium]|nr:hypothetical protein [Ignavibacteria bacterium]